jgi:hypothetical protein
MAICTLCGTGVGTLNRHCSGSNTGVAEENTGFGTGFGSGKVAKPQICSLVALWQPQCSGNCTGAVLGGNTVFVTEFGTEKVAKAPVWTTFGVEHYIDVCRSVPGL